MIEWTPKARAVLNAASELFYERGIHAVGVDMIAERAGVTKKTLYDRFGSKERLVVEYLSDRDRRWNEFLAERLAATPEQAAAQLTAVFDAAADWAAAYGEKGCSMIKAHAEISEPAHPAYAVIVGQKRRMLELFTRIARSAGHPAPADAGALVLMLHEGAVVTAGIGVVDAAFARARDLALEVLANGAG